MDIFLFISTMTIWENAPTKAILRHLEVYIYLLLAHYYVQAEDISGILSAINSLQVFWEQSLVFGHLLIAMQIIISQIINRGLGLRV